MDLIDRTSRREGRTSRFFCREEKSSSHFSPHHTCKASASCLPQANASCSNAALHTAEPCFIQSAFALIELLVSKTCQICVSLLFYLKNFLIFATTLLRPAGYGGQDWSKTTPLFLKKGEGLGEGKNLFSREKKFFPSPKRITRSGS